MRPPWRKRAGSTSSSILNGPTPIAISSSKVIRCSCFQRLQHRRITDTHLLRSVIDEHRIPKGRRTILVVEFDTCSLTAEHGKLVFSNKRRSPIRQRYPTWIHAGYFFGLTAVDPQVGYFCSSSNSLISLGKTKASSGISTLNCTLSISMIWDIPLGSNCSILKGILTPPTSR